MRDIVLTMPAVALRGMTILPGMIAHFDISRSKSIRAVEEAMSKDQQIFLVTQKDVEQATQLYPLSDFKIHNTANIENGYLAGRYGGIPFLSNLQDLHW